MLSIINTHTNQQKFSNNLLKYLILNDLPNVDNSSHLTVHYHWLHNTEGDLYKGGVGVRNIHILWSTVGDVAVEEGCGEFVLEG